MCTQDTEDDRTLLTTAYSTLAGNPVFDGLMTGTREVHLPSALKLEISY
jgi:hypothetical protein